MKRSVWLGGLVGSSIFSVVLWRGQIPDTEEALFPDPEMRTVFRMSQLDHAIGRYWEAQGRAPTHLDSLARAEPNVEYYRMDAWGHPFELMATDTVVILRSAGLDGERSTWDDILQFSTDDSTWYSKGM